MTRKNDGRRSTLSLIEQSVHMLRSQPLRLLWPYYAGTVPFMIGLLYFWTDMSTDPDAGKYCISFSLGIAVLFIWMKSWHVLFTHHVRQQVLAMDQTHSNVKQILHAIMVQTVIQATGLFVLPLAFITVVPFCWVYAFYQNVTVADVDQELTVTKAIAKALDLTRIWPVQILFFTIFLMVLVILVWVNLSIVMFYLPHLINTLLGIDTIYSMSGGRFLSSTFFAVVGSMTFLCLDPLTKTFFTLRAFYASSLKTGQDLLSQLKKINHGKQMIWIAVSLGAMVLTHQAVAKDLIQSQAFVEKSSARIDPDKLRHSIEHVLEQREYAWRIPKSHLPVSDNKPGFFDNLFKWIEKQFKGTGTKISNQIDRWTKWLERLFPGSRSKSRLASDHSGSIRLTLLFFSLASLALAIVIGWRAWQRRKSGKQKQLPKAQAPIPDLSDESITADDLSTDAWMDLATSHIQKKEFRLALRAMYLAMLAMLGDHQMLVIEKYKSNRDYIQELTRRAHHLEGCADLFSENTHIFEKAWYGMYPVSMEQISQFNLNDERIKSAVSS